MESLKNVFAVSELRNRILFTLALLGVFRVGHHITTPGVNIAALAELARQMENTMFGMYDMFSGGNLSRVTIFALGIMPYISASIILQLLTVVWPYLEKLSKEGELGRRKITQYTRYGTVVLSIVQSLGIAIFLERQTARHVRLPFEEVRDAERLHEAQDNRPVARVLRDLAAPELAFLRQPLEVRPDDGEQLQDDRRADVRHDAEREDRDARQAPAGEHVVHAEHRVLELPRELAERREVHPRHGDVVADAIHREQPQRVQHTLAKIRDREDVLQAFVHASCSVAPPAAAIFSAAFPLNLCARTVSALPTSPRARTFTLRSLPWTSPRSRRSSGVTTVPASNFSPSVSRFTTSYSTRNGLWNPRLGTRRCSGICPPSNPRLNLKPERDFAPLCPRPAVLP